MISGSLRKLFIVLALTLLFVLWPGKPAAGITTSRPQPSPISPEEARARLTEGFQQIMDFFAQRDFSLLAAWREMRSSADPDFFAHRYPAISRELDVWAAALERKYGVPGTSEGSLDFTFLLIKFGPTALDPNSSSVMRDNAVATICMVCVMDSLRCHADAFHRFLAAVVADDPSPARKAEALRWWRRSDGFIDEGLLEEVLSSPAGADPDLRAEIAKVLFSIGTRRSLQAQRLLAGTAGLPSDPLGGQPQIACTAIRHFARARFEEAAPELIEALQDPSLEVRACAAESLGSLSGREFGFDPKTDTPANREAIARWRTWWQQRGSDSGGAAR